MPAELAGTLAPTEAERLMQAEALVRSYCGWHIAPPRTETVKVDGWGASVLTLPTLHLTAVVQVTDTDVVVSVDSYEWSEAGYLTHAAQWSRKPRGVEVQFTHGYTLPPAEVTAVVQSVAQRAVDNPGSLVRTQDGPFSDTYSQTGLNQSLPMALLDAEKDILNRYRLPPRP